MRSSVRRVRGRSLPSIGRLSVAVTILCLGAEAPASAQPSPGGTPSSVAANADAAALVKSAVEALPKVPFKATLRLTPDDGPARTLELSHKAVGGARANFLEVQEPKELAGIRFLFLESATGAPEQYIKIPVARSPVRAEGQIRKQSFLESSFYVADLVEPKLDDFTYAFAGDGEVLGRKVKLVEVKPKRPNEEIYGRTVLAIDPVDRLILKREFFDPSGKPLKVWTIDKVDKVDGIWTFREQTMENLQRKTKSRLETVAISYDVDLPDDRFDPRSLAK